MNEIYDPLFTPWKAGNVQIRNCIVMLPMEGTNMIVWEAKTKFVKGIEELLATAGGYVNGVQNKFMKKESGGPQICFVGDCDKVGSLRTVIKQAYELVRDISYGKQEL